ncbi:unnamed protein product [Prunus brigantina]
MLEIASALKLSPEISYATAVHSPKIASHKLGLLSKCQVPLLPSLQPIYRTNLALGSKMTRPFVTLPTCVTHAQGSPRVIASHLRERFKFSQTFFSKRNFPNEQQTHIAVEFSLTSRAERQAHNDRLGDYMITISIRRKMLVPGSECQSSRTSKSPTKKSLLNQKLGGLLFVPYLTPHSRHGTWKVNNAETSSVSHAKRAIGILHRFIRGRQRVFGRHHTGVLDLACRFFLQAESSITLRGRTPRTKGFSDPNHPHHL